jgi:hypothetical protein
MSASGVAVLSSKNGIYDLAGCTRQPNTSLQPFSGEGNHEPLRLKSGV